MTPGEVDVKKYWIVGLALFLLATGQAVLLAQSEAQGVVTLPGRFPPAGIDEFPVSIAQIAIDFTLDGIPEGDLSAEGPFVVERGDPRPEGGSNVIDVEIVQMNLTGTSPLGPVRIRESPTRRSVGRIVALQEESDFPADSFFDVFVEIQIGDTQFENRTPIRMQAIINEIPPRITVYRSLADPVVELFIVGTDILAALFLHVAHAPNPDFEPTLHDLKILIERVQLKIDLVNAKMDLFEKNQTQGLVSRLLFPYNVSVAPFFETGIAIDNITNLFGGGTAGAVSFSLVPANNPQQPIAVSSAQLVGIAGGLDNQGNIPPGGTMTVLVNQLLAAAGLAGQAFTGQILAQTDFPAAQGINFISDPAFNRQSQGYPAVVIR